MGCADPLSLRSLKGSTHPISNLEFSLENPEVDESSSMTCHVRATRSNLVRTAARRRRLGAGILAAVWHVHHARCWAKRWGRCRRRGRAVVVRNRPADSVASSVTAVGRRVLWAPMRGLHTLAKGCGARVRAGCPRPVRPGFFHDACPIRAAKEIAVAGAVVPSISHNIRGLARRARRQDMLWRRGCRCGRARCAAEAEEAPRPVSKVV